MRLIAASAVFLALTACSTPENVPAQNAVRSSAASSLSSSSSSTRVSSASSIGDPTADDHPALLPSLSVESFASMDLHGSDLVFENVQTTTDAYTRYTISYGSNGLRITGIMNIPHGDGPFPLLILNHGYIDPKVYTNGRGLKREQDYLARQGFAVLHSDYRGHAGSDESPDEKKIYDAGLEYSMDIVNAIHALTVLGDPRIDLDRIGMLGHSMGGGIALNIAVAYPDIVDAVVLYAPVNTDAWENFWRWRREREEDDRTTAVLETREENPDAWDKLSSRTYLDRIAVPILLFHGTNDKDVPKAWSDDLADRLENLGKDIEYVVYEGEGHEYAAKFTDFMRRTAAFFAQNLR